MMKDISDNTGWKLGLQISLVYQIIFNANNQSIAMDQQFDQDYQLMFGNSHELIFTRVII